MWTQNMSQSTAISGNFVSQACVSISTQASRSADNYSIWTHILIWYWKLLIDKTSTRFSDITVCVPSWPSRPDATDHRSTSLVERSKKIKYKLWHHVWTPFSNWSLVIKNDIKIVSSLSRWTSFHVQYSCIVFRGFLDNEHLFVVFFLRSWCVRSDIL